MAYVVTDIDKYLKSKKYGFYQLITKEWGRKDPDVIEIKKLWQEAENATGTNSKIEKFKKLQEKLTPLFESWDKQIKSDDEYLGKYGETAFSDPGNQHDYDFGKKFLEYSDMPKANKMDNLQLGQAFSEHYDVEQMTNLAAKYGYDYRNKEERNEFLKRVGEYVKQHDLEKIWGDDLYTSLVTPIAKEYAKKNYENIEGLGDLMPALAADVGVNTLMAGVPGGAASKVTTNKLVQEVADNVAAPVARQTARILMNDVDPEEAVKAGFSEAATNYATPYAMKGMWRWGNRMVGREEALTAQKYINQMANKARATSKKINEGVPFQVRIVDKADDAGRPVEWKYEYKRYNPNTKQIETVDLETWAKSKGRITQKDMTEFGDFAKAKRGKMTPGEATVYADNLADGAGPKNIEDKMFRASQAGQDPLSVLSKDELQLAAGTPKPESWWNWAKSSRPVSDAAALMTNLQGRSQYAGPMLGQFSRAIPGLDLSKQLEYTAPVDQNDPEVKMYKRNYILHQANPDLVPEPPKPEKYKDLSTEEIFGGK